MPSEKNLQPRWQKGQSGNPGGPPKGVIARGREFIRTQTDDGFELWRFYLGVMRNPEERTVDQLAAATELANRLYGKAPQIVDVDTTGQTRARLDMDSLPIEKRRELLKALDEIGALEVADGGDSEH